MQRLSITARCWPGASSSTGCGVPEWAKTRGGMLGPGELVRVQPRPTGWLRFNVAFSNDARLFELLARQIEQHASQQGE